MRYVATLLLLLTLTASVAPAQRKSGVGLRIGLSSVPLEFPLPDHKAAWFYKVYDLDFARTPIKGRIRFTYYSYGPPPGPELLLLETPRTHWTEHLRARLFRDGLEMGPAEYDISFTPKKGDGFLIDATANPAVLLPEHDAEVLFTLSGPDGAALEAGVYRLWILLDMSDLPPAPGAFRGLAVNDPGAYEGRGGSRPDPGHFGGLVFEVVHVGQDTDRLVDYLAQRVFLAGRDLMHYKQPGFIVDRRKVSVALKLAEEIQAAVAAHPEDVRLMTLAGVLYSDLHDCDSAGPYFQKMLRRSNTWYFAKGYHRDLFVDACLGEAIRRRGKRQRPQP